MRHFRSNCREYCQRGHLTKICIPSITMIVGIEELEKGESYKRG
jgi:hypothetical protein